MEKLNVAVIFGGCSPEYSVSLESAHAVVTHMDRTRYNPVLIGISSAGNWYHFTGEAEKIRLDTWNTPADCTPALVSPDRDSRALLVLKNGAVEKITLDAAFPVLHGCRYLPVTSFVSQEHIPTYMQMIFPCQQTGPQRWSKAGPFIKQ